MTPKKARELVAKKLKGYKVREEKPAAAIASDAARQKPTVELVSPSLASLKRRYFGDNAAAQSPPPTSDGEDTGIVVVEKGTAGGKSQQSQAIVFNKGKIIGRQG